MPEDLPDRPLLPWIVESERTLLETPILKLRGVRSRSALHPARGGEFIVVDTPDWVNVIALTPEGEVVLVEQHRHGTGELTLEIPGGMVDPGEDFEEAGSRELLEETGYAGDPPERIGLVHPNPAIQRNRCATLLVRNARFVQAPEPDETEELRVRTVPLAGIAGLIQGGVITHALVVAAFYHLQVSGRP